MIAGIDPGQRGAIAIINGMNVVSIHDLEVTPEDSARVLMDALKGFQGLVVVENPLVLPAQSAQSGMSAGLQYGAIIGVLVALNLSFRRVDARKWQKEVLTITMGKLQTASSQYERRKMIKENSITNAKNLFPLAQIGKKDGRADALLMAYYLLKETRNYVLHEEDVPTPIKASDLIF